MAEGKIVQGPAIKFPVNEWMIYHCMANDELHRREFNLAIYPSTPLATHPYMFRMEFSYNVPPGSGLIDDDNDIRLEEAARQFEHESGMRSSWLLPIFGRSKENKAKVILVGSETTLGHRKYFFYVRESRIDKRAFDRCFAGFSAEIFYCHDPQWDVYRKELFPGTAVKSLIMNLALIESRIKEGDDITREREVDHVVVFKTAEGRDSFIAMVKDDGWKIVVPNKEEAEDLAEFPVLLTRTHKPDRVNADICLIALNSRAELFGGHYDGWGAPIVKTEDSSGHQQPPIPQ